MCMCMIEEDDQYAASGFIFHVFVSYSLDVCGAWLSDQGFWQRRRWRFVLTWCFNLLLLFYFIFLFVFFFELLTLAVVFLAHMFEWVIKLEKELVIGFYVGDWGVASIWNIISPQFSAFACNIFVNIILSKKVKILWAIYGESNGARWPNLVFYQNPSVWWGSGELTVRSNTVIVEGQSL